MNSCEDCRFILQCNPSDKTMQDHNLCFTEWYDEQELYNLDGDYIIDADTYWFEMSYNTYIDNTWEYKENIQN